MSKKASIIFGIVITIIIGLWLWTGFIPKNYISIGGSTSVDPVMQRLTNKYAKNDKKNDNFIYSSSGSRGGLSNMESGIYKMGFISKEIDADLTDKVVPADDGPKFDVTKTVEENTTAISEYLIGHQSDADKLNYLQIGTDAIILTYYATEDFAKNYADKFVINPAVEKDRELIYEIYQRNLNFSQIAERLTGQSPDEIKTNLKDPKNYNPVIPFARETGSGTRNSFEGLFQFKAIEDKKIENGEKIGPSKAIEYNSNGIMYQGIAAAVNSFGYLSLNYLNSVNSDPHLKAVIISDGTTQFDPLAKENFDENGKVILENFEKYPLTRPYIGLFKTTLDQALLDKFAAFFAWIGEALKTDVETDSRKIYQLEGLIPVLKFNYALKPAS